MKNLILAILCISISVGSAIFGIIMSVGATTGATTGASSKLTPSNMLEAELKVTISILEKSLERRDKAYNLSVKNPDDYAAGFEFIEAQAALKAQRELSKAQVDAMMASKKTAP